MKCCKCGGEVDLKGLEPLDADGVGFLCGECGDQCGLSIDALRQAFEEPSMEVEFYGGPGDGLVVLVPPTANPRCTVGGEPYVLDQSPGGKAFYDATGRIRYRHAPPSA